jgi:hypothetical protein
MNSDPNLKGVIINKDGVEVVKAPMNLGDDCPITAPTIEQEWQWYVDDMRATNPEGTKLLGSDPGPIPEWFKQKYERDREYGHYDAPLTD